MTVAFFITLLFDSARDPYADEGEATVVRCQGEGLGGTGERKSLIAGSMKWCLFLRHWCVCVGKCILVTKQKNTRLLIRTEVESHAAVLSKLMRRTIMLLVCEKAFRALEDGWKSKKKKGRKDG